METYFLLRAQDETLVLPPEIFQSEGEIQEYFNQQAEFNGTHPSRIVLRYHKKVGEIREVNPFDYTSSNGNLRFTIREPFRQELLQRGEKIKKDLTQLCSNVASDCDQEELTQEIYGDIKLQGEIYVLDYTLFDFANCRDVQKSLLFLQTEFDKEIPVRENDDELDFSLGLHSILLYGRNPTPRVWVIQSKSIGSLDCTVKDLPRTLKLVNEKHLKSIIEKDRCPF